MTIDRKAVIENILAWNAKKSWSNYQGVRRNCFLNANNLPKWMFFIYTCYKPIWNTLIGKYRRCEKIWREDGTVERWLGNEEKCA